MAHDDDSLEIEVIGVPAPEPPPQQQPRYRRPRTPNPVVDEVIHTGEIQPRSMIIRATESSPSLPKVEIRTDETPTQITAPPLPAPAVQAPRKAPWLLLVGAAVIGIGAGVLTMIDKPAAPAPVEDQSAHLAVQTAAQFIGTTLDADAKATLMRADVIASSSMLRAGILTDAQTLEDMAKDKDVVFSLKDGESVEVFQDRGGARTSMLRLPKTASAIQAPPVGKATLALRNGVPQVLANAEIPVQQDTSGEVVLAVPVDLEPFKKRIADHVVEASLTGLGAPVVLVKNTSAQAGSKVTVLIENEENAKISLEAVVPTKIAAAAPKSPLRVVRFAMLGLAAAMLVGFLGSFLRKPNAA